MRVALRVSAWLIAAGAAVLVFSKPNGAHPNTWHFLHVTIALLFISALFAFALSRLENDAEQARLLPYYLLGQWIAAFNLIAKFPAIFEHQIPIGPLAPFFTASREAARHSPNCKRATKKRSASPPAREIATGSRDSIKQHVFAIQTSAATVQVAAPEAASALERVRQSACDTMTELETMLDQLRAEALGRAKKEIASALSIGDETVKTHVSNLVAKLRAENRGDCSGPAAPSVDAGRDKVASRVFSVRRLLTA